MRLIPVFSITQYVYDNIYRKRKKVIPMGHAAENCSTVHRTIREGYIMKRWFVLLVVLTLLLCACGEEVPPATEPPTAAPTAAPTEAPKLDEEMVRAAIDHYFAQRKDFLMGTSENIAIANLPIVTDEAAHRAAMETGEATLTDSTVEIVLVECGDTMAEAEVTETVVFEINGETVRESVRHRIYMFLHEDGNVYVSGDGYKENTTGFVSCSYIDPEVVSQ